MIAFEKRAAWCNFKILMKILNPSVKIKIFFPRKNVLDFYTPENSLILELSHACPKKQTFSIKKFFYTLLLKN